MVPSLLNVLFRNVVKVAKVIAFDELRKKWSKIRNHPPADNSRIGDDVEKVPCDDKFPDRDLSANDPVLLPPTTPPHPTRPHSTHLPLRLCDDVSFFYGSMAVFGVFHSISLWEVALFLSER
jgi:hypothetical protein